MYIFGEIEIFEHAKTEEKKLYKRPKNIPKEEKKHLCK